MCWSDAGNGGDDVEEEVGEIQSVKTENETLVLTQASQETSGSDSGQPGPTDAPHQPSDHITSSVSASGLEKRVRMSGWYKQSIS